MHFSTSFLSTTTTLLAATALAAPTSTIPSSDAGDDGGLVSFKVSRPGLKGKTMDARAELARTRRKHGLPNTNENDLLSSLDAWLSGLDSIFGDGGAAPNPNSGSNNGNGNGNAVAAGPSPTPSPAPNANTGEVKATPFGGGGEFLEKVTIGTQQFEMDFDTGSSNLWVFSTNLGQQKIGGHTAFNGNASQTFQATQGGAFQISYGDNSFASGTVGKDDVTIGGLKVKTSVGVADNVAAQFVQDTDNDGLVGLAFDSINTVTINGQHAPQKTFFSDVKAKLKKPLFSVDLAADKTGTYEFGNIDATRFQGQLKKVPVNKSQGFWQFSSNFATVDGNKIANQGGQAIADTGTSLMLVDDKVAAGYYKQVPQAQFNQQVGGFIYPCKAQLPDFGVDMGGATTAVVPGNQITFQKLTKNVCFGGVQPSGGGAGGLQIYGDTFFQANYVVFDDQGPQLQVAAKA